MLIIIIDNKQKITAETRIITIAVKLFIKISPLETNDYLNLKGSVVSFFAENFAFTIAISVSSVPNICSI